MYFPQFSELKREIEQNRRFKIEMMEIIKHPLEDIPLSSDFITSMFRAILYTIIKEHFGEVVADELFDRFAKKLAKFPIDFKNCENHVNYFILLKRR